MAIMTVWWNGFTLVRFLLITILVLAMANLKKKSKLLAFKRDKCISIKPISEAVKEPQIDRSIRQILYMFYWKYSTQWQRDNHLDDLNMLLIHRAWHEVKAHNGSLLKRHILDPQEHLAPTLVISIPTSTSYSTCIFLNKMANLSTEHFTHFGISSRNWHVIRVKTVISLHVKCHQMSNVIKFQMSSNVKCHKMSNVINCQMSSNVKCHQMSSNVKCHQMSNVIKCQMSSYVKCHQM